MEIEASRRPVQMKMRWPLIPKGLSKDQARNYFNEHVKPRGYKYAHFGYNPRTGLVETIEES